MNRILINKIESTEGDWWECYCDKYGRSSCHGIGNSPEESLINFLYELKIFEEIINKEEEIKYKFTKDDLKAGDSVKFRNGYTGWVNTWVNTTEHKSIFGISYSSGELLYEEFNHDLKHRVLNELDIVVVYRMSENGRYEIIWEGE